MIEIPALHSSGTQKLVLLPLRKFTICCRWVYAVKVGPVGRIDGIKVHLVAKGNA